MIRQYNERDITQVTRIWIDSHIRNHGFISTDLWRNGVDTINKSISRSDVYVSIDKKTINGFIQLDGTEIIGLYVALGRHSRKIMAQLLTHAKQLSPVLHLHAYMNDDESIKIYNSCGFEVVGSVQNELTDEPELLLTLKSN